MQDYFGKLQARLDKYKYKYAKKPKRAALNLIWWNLQYMFTKSKNRQNKNDGAKIALYINGGLGDYLMDINYALYLYEYLDNKVEIDIFAKNYKAAEQLAGNAVPFKFYSRDEFNKVNGYAVKIHLNRFPKIVYYNKNAIDKYMPKFTNILDAVLDLHSKVPMYFDLDPAADALTIQYARINGAKKRIQQPDILQLLNVAEDFKLHLIPENKEEILAKFGLTDTKFISLNRGTDAGFKGSEVTRMWPVEYYEQLVLKLREKYPEYKIVQLGYSKECCKEIAGIDFDLRGETTLSDLKTILYASALHIDYDGGMIHMKKALHTGKSVVLFGPTEPDWLGYAANINICAYKCRFCDFLNADWNKRCSNIRNPQICMKSITPDMVLQEIIQHGEL